MPIPAGPPTVTITQAEFDRLHAQATALTAVTAALQGHLARPGAITRAQVAAALALATTGA